METPQEIERRKEVVNLLKAILTEQKSVREHLIALKKKVDVVRDQLKKK